MKRLSIIAIVLVWCCHLPILGADWIPFVINYGSNDYGNGASTWRILSHGQWTFFANQQGLLTYNGVNWHHYPLNNKSENRGIALSADNKRIYVGGENEFGYFEVGNDGALKYHCMSDNAPEKFRHVGNIWDYYENNGIQYFRGDNCIIVVAGKKMSAVYTEDNMFNSIMIKGTIYVATDHGVKMFVGNQFISVPNGEVLEGKRLNGLLPFKNGMMVGTSNDGLFYYDGKQVTPYKTGIDNVLKDSEISCMVIHKGKIAIGTIHDGLVIIDTATGDWQIYNEATGLQNNTILSVAFDPQGNVWAGMDYGIDHILIESPFSYLYRSPNSLGIGYSSIMKDGLLYLGTDRGLYVANYPIIYNSGQPQIQRVACPSGPAWYLYEHNGELFCMHDKGIFTVKGAIATRITNIMGAWYCSGVIGQPDMMLVGVYDGIFVLRKINGMWTSMGKINGINGSGRYFKQTGKHTLEVYNPNMGTAMEYSLTGDFKRVVGSKLFKNKVWKSSNNVDDKLLSDWNITGNLLKLNKKDWIVPYDKGFAMIDIDKVQTSQTKMIITRMYLTSADDSVLYLSNYLGIKAEPRISYENNTVCFDYSVQSRLSAKATKYQYRLNKGDWSPLSAATTKEYGGLFEGKYTFEVRAFLYDGTITTDSISFVILPPWYRSWVAYLIYFLIIIGVILVLIRFERKRILGKTQAAVYEKNKEVKKMKGEIDKLEQDKLELDMLHKSQEIANLMINVNRKNEMLDGLKKEIQQVAGRIETQNAKECKRQLLLINNKIESNMEGDDVLKRFEEQFDVVNDMCLRKLSKLHPDLNANERMMCAYLRMNLSTKDIAPLLNLSVRGVESIRYRLRKKLNLERDENIMEYLNSL